MTTFECLNGLPYLNQVILEGLRFNPPIPQSPSVDIIHDCKIGKFNFKVGDKMCFNYVALHQNENEWQRPLEFLPERFDHADPLSLTPGGKKRNPYSFAPFNGGKRICFGKTFADMNMKVVAIYASQYFNWVFQGEKYSATKFPMLHLGMSKPVPIEMKLTQYNG